MVKNPPANTGGMRDKGPIPGLGGSPGGGHGNPLLYSCLENPMDRGAWRAAVHGVAKSRNDLETLHTYWIDFTDFLFEVLNITDTKCFLSSSASGAYTCVVIISLFICVQTNCKWIQLVKNILIMALIQSLLNIQIYVCAQRELNVYMMISV